MFALTAKLGLMIATAATLCFAQTSNQTSNLHFRYTDIGNALQDPSVTKILVNYRHYNQSAPDVSPIPKWVTAGDLEYDYLLSLHVVTEGGCPDTLWKVSESLPPTTVDHASGQFTGPYVGTRTPYILWEDNKNNKIPFYKQCC